MISICRDRSANVKRWRDGQMALRWCAAGMVEAGKQFCRSWSGWAGWIGAAATP
jgi:putative transposase